MEGERFAQTDGGSAADRYAAIDVELFCAGERFLRDVDGSVHSSIRIEADSKITLSIKIGSAGVRNGAAGAGNPPERSGSSRQSRPAVA
jgi:predicted regulator of Ras-like GTPase activity (Roadblock/LC7/MglB family)